MTRSARATARLSEECDDTIDSIRDVRASIRAAAADNHFSPGEVAEILSAIDDAETDAHEAQVSACLVDGAIGTVGALLHTCELTPWVDRRLDELRTDQARLRPVITVMVSH